MAEGKKTFIFYSDWINMIKEMPDTDAGLLLKHVLGYVNDENPEIDNILVKMAFAHMKPMLKTDLDKWEIIREKRKKAGAKGGQANAKQIEANAKQLEAVNDNVNVNVNELIPTTEKIKNIDIVYSLFVKEIKEGYHTQWAEQTYMQLGLKKGSLTTLINNFKSHLIRSDKFHKTVSEFKDHLNNWLNNLDSIGKLNEYKLKSIGAL